MKNSLKHSNTITTCETELQRELSELLEIKSLLNLKLAPLAKTIDRDVTNFVARHSPKDDGRFSLVNMENNLFGTQRTFSEFTANFKTLLHTLEADIKGVVQVLEKFPTTKGLSLFITEGVVDNMLKMSKVMLWREQHCQKVMQKVQQDLLSNKGIYTNGNESQLCKKCQSHIEQSHITHTHQTILFGGEKIYNYYKKSIQGTVVAESEEDNGRDFVGCYYDRIMKIKREVKRSTVNMGVDELQTQENMKYTLDRLQSNLEHRKFQILACLVEMGQFGIQVGNQFGIDANSHAKPNLNLPDKPSNQSPKLLPKFNYKHFTFNIGKHFCKSIKQIETELDNIKHKYSHLLQTQFAKFTSKSTQSNLDKDSFDISMQNYKRKTQTKIANLHARIDQLEQTNKIMKHKIAEFGSITIDHLNSRIQLDRMEVAKTVMQKTMQKTVDKYEGKVKDQQSQLKTLKMKQKPQKKKGNQETQNGKGSRQVSNLSSASNNSPLITSTELEGKENIEKGVKISFEKLTNSKKTSMFLQPMMKRLGQRQSQTMSNRSSIASIVEGSQNEQTNQHINGDFHKKVGHFNDRTDQNITELTIQNCIDQTCKMVESIKVVEENLVSHQQLSNCPGNMNQKLSLYSCMISVNIGHSLSYRQPGQSQLDPDLLASLTKSLQCPEPQHILNNTPISSKKLPLLKSKNPPKNKLLKAKSHQDSKNFKQDLHENQIIAKGNGKLSSNAEVLKRYVSEYSAYPANVSKQQNANRKAMKEKSSRNIVKTLSLTTLNKQSNSPHSNSLKLPSLSKYQKVNKSSQKAHIQPMQKLASIQKNSSLLTKKKRKKRHFSQQPIGMDSVYGSDIAMSLSNNMMKVKKKQYIIDFIPNVEDQHTARCHLQCHKFVEDSVQGLFAVESQTVNQQQTQRQQQDKDKHKKGKTSHSKTTIFAPQMTTRLTNIEISLSTKLYSLMASIKSSNLSLYSLLRQKLQQQYQLHESNNQKKIKNNCDNGEESLREASGEKLKIHHLPLAMQKGSRQDKKDSSFEMQSNFQTVSTNTNQIEQEKNVNKKTGGENEQKQLRQIINSIILQHRNHSCERQLQQGLIDPQKDKETCEEKENKQKGLTKNTCKHIMQFYLNLTSLNSSQ